MGQTIEQHTKKTVQMHCLARNSAGRLEEFGPVLSYNKIYFGKCGDECVTVEEFIPGNFEKYVNNTGEVCGDPESDICKKAECFAHYSFIRSDNELMVLDIQGCDDKLCDPEVATQEPQLDGEYLFCTGNLSSSAIESFSATHVCNDFCKILGLPEF